VGALADGGIVAEVVQGYQPVRFYSAPTATIAFAVAAKAGRWADLLPIEGVQLLLVISIVAYYLVGVTVPLSLGDTSSLLFKSPPIEGGRHQGQWNMVHW